ncbi:hypothetical protein EBR04_08745, partial [bacterium]|nr:hypothetical protein [bacterium]
MRLRFVASMPARPMLAALVVWLAVAGRMPAASAALPPDAIQQAIEKARAWLVKQQRPDGAWVSAMRAGNDNVGPTGLVMLALANAGVTAKDPAMVRALDWMRTQKPDETYSVSLQTLALAMRCSAFEIGVPMQSLTGFMAAPGGYRARRYSPTFAKAYPRYAMPMPGLPRQN